jgi:outer membrane protein
MRKLTIIYIFLFACSHLSAQQINPELKGLINQSFTYFPQFNELNQHVQVASDKVSLIQASRLPKVDASASYQYDDPISSFDLPVNGQLENFKITPNNNYSTAVNASYVLLDFGMVKANVDKAKKDLQYARDNVAYNQAQTAYQVANIYYQIIYLKKAVAIQDSVINFLKANKQDTEVKLKHGDALRYDVLSIQSTIDQAENAKIDLQNSQTRQYNLLQYITGSTQNSGTQFDFSGEGAVKAEDALAAAQSNSPGFTLLKDHIAQSEADLAASRNGGKPSVVLSASTGFVNGYGPDLDAFKYNYNAGVTLRIPIYLGGTVRKQIRLSQSQLRETNLRKESMSNDYLKDIKQALVDIESNRNSLINVQKQIDEVQEAKKLAQSRYRNGTGTNLELTNASTNVQQVQLTQLRYKFQLCQAQLELARLTGEVYW